MKQKKEDNSAKSTASSELNVAPQKDPFETLLHDTCSIIDSESLRNKPQRLWQLFKRYKEDLTISQKDHLFAILAKTDGFASLATLVIADASVGGRAKFSRQFANRLKIELARKLGVPVNSDEIVRRNFSSEILVAISDWIDECMAAGNIENDWITGVIGCLLSEEIDAAKLDLINKVIERSIFQNAKLGKSRPGMVGAPTLKIDRNVQLYIRKVIPLITAQKKQFLKLKFAYEFTAVFRTQREIAQNENDKLNNKVASLIDELADLKVKLEELASLKITNDDLKRSAEDKINKLENDLILERKRYELLEQHMEIRIKQELAGQAHSIQKRLSHELSEAKICLRKDNPNIEWAYERVENIERILGEFRDESKYK
jgi:hypothetical protein